MGLISRVSSRTYRNKKTHMLRLSRAVMAGFKREVVTAGKGVKATAGKPVEVHYVGTLKDGTVFDSSRKRGEPFVFTPGTQQVIRGWDEGVAQMEIGETAVLTCPPEYAYGPNGYPPVIPRNATLTFEVELLGEAPAGFTREVETEGTGASPQRGQMVKVHYTGRLENGTKFDSSVDRGQPFEFQIGVGQVIKGWDEGVLEMKIGEKSLLTITPEFGYGERGAGGVIPPNATLLFEVELSASVRHPPHSLVADVRDV